MSHPVPLIHKIEQSFLRAEPLPEFRPGDTIRVQVKIREGEKERLQAFEGVCIRRTRGAARATFTVRKVSYGVGVERVFAENSPNIAGIEVLTRGKVRQARLYFLRNLSGKAARLKERAYQPREEDRDKPKGKKRGSHRRAAVRAEAPAAPPVAEAKKGKRQARKQAKAKAKATKGSQAVAAQPE